MDRQYRRMPMYDVGKAIRIVRTVKGLRLGELAKSAKISAPFLSLIERSERQPSLDVIRRIADALRLPSELLILMSVARDGTLRTTDSRTDALASALRKLMEAEQSLCERLKKESSKREAKRHKSR